MRNKEGEPFEVELIDQENPWHSLYFNLAVKRMGEVVPELVPTLEKTLTNLDQQGIAKFQIHTSKSSDIEIPYTTISVNQLFDEVFKPQTETDQVSGQDTKEKYTIVICPPLSLPPAGHPFSPWDIVMDRVIGEMGKFHLALKENRMPPRVDVIVLGSPNSLLGKVTKEWLQKKSKRRREIYGEEYLQILNQQAVFSGDEENQHILIQSMSAGAMTARELMKEINNEPDKTKSLKVQQLADNPAGIQEGNLKDRIEHGLQSIVGVTFEASMRKLFKDERAISATGENEEYQKELLLRLGDKVGERKFDYQKELKWKSFLLDVLDMVIGSPDESEDITYIRQGLFDPTSFVTERLPLTILKVLTGKKIPSFKKGKTTEYPTQHSHFIDRIRVKKWARILGLLEKYKN